MDDKLFEEAKVAYNRIKAPDRLAEKILDENLSSKEEIKDFKVKDYSGTGKRKRLSGIYAVCSIAACMALIFAVTDILPDAGEKNLPDVFVNGQLVKNSTIVCEPAPSKARAITDLQPEEDESAEAETIDVEVKLAQQGKISVSDGTLKKVNEPQAEGKVRIARADAETEVTAESMVKTIAVEPEESICWSIINAGVDSDMIPAHEDTYDVTEIKEYTLEVTEDGKTVTLILRKNEETNLWEIIREPKQENSEKQEKEGEL